MFHSYHSFLKCHWNLNGLSFQNFIKVPLLRASVTSKKIDTICLSETYLNSSVLSNDADLDFIDYNFVRADHPSNTKWVVLGSTLRTPS